MLTIAGSSVLRRTHLCVQRGNVNEGRNRMLRYDGEEARTLDGSTTDWGVVIQR